MTFDTEGKKVICIGINDTGNNYAWKDVFFSTKFFTNCKTDPTLDAK